MIDSETLTLFLAAYLIGLSVAAPIGPVNIEIIRRGLTIGPGAAFALGCGAVTADCIYFGVAFTATELASSVLDSKAGMRIALAIGGGFLGWLGVRAIRSAMTGGERTDALIHAGQSETNQPAARTIEVRGEENKQSRSELLKTYGLGLAMTLSNPMTIIFWLSLAASFAAGEVMGTPLLGLGGVAAGTFSWVVFIVSAIALARRWVNRLFVRWVDVVSGIVLIGFGLRFLWRAYLA